MRRAVAVGVGLLVAGTGLAPGAVVGQATGGGAAAPTRPGVLRSWTSDAHVLQVGDIVTILVDEFLLVSANRAEVASREKDRQLGLTGGATGTTMGGGVRTENDVADRRRGEASRQERFSAEMSARVVEVAPSGTLRIEGTKKLRIDDHEQEVTIRGWIRPQDLSMENTIESWRIGDAEVLYASNGKLGKAGGIWSRILDLIWP